LSFVPEMEVVDEQHRTMAARIVDPDNAQRCAGGCTANNGHGIGSLASGSWSSGSPACGSRCELRVYSADLVVLLAFLFFNLLSRNFFRLVTHILTNFKTFYISS
jgi:hypothetical protein